MWQTQGSYLALTNQGWEQITNFIVFGILSILYAVGLRRTFSTGRASVWGPLLVGLFGLGMVALGVFVTDPGDGYPPGTPLQTDPTTWHGVTHGLTGLVTVTLVLTAMCFVFSRRFLADPRHRRWGTYAWLTGALIIVISVPGTVGLPFAYRAGFPVIDGLIQRWADPENHYHHGLDLDGADGMDAVAGGPQSACGSGCCSGLSLGSRSRMTGIRSVHL